MVKFKKGLLVITLISLITLSIRPFSIYADSITSLNVIGVEPRILDYNVSVNPQTQTFDGTTYAAVDYVLEFVVKLDSYYYGEIAGDLSFYWDSYNLTSSSATPVRNNTNINNKTYYVNGNSFIISYNLRAIQIVNISHEDLFDPYYPITFNIDSSDVINLENYKQYNFPYESLKSNLFLMSKGYTYIMLNYATFEYPLYSISNGDQLAYYWVGSNNKLYMIFAIDKNINSTNQIQGTSLTDYFTFSGAFSSFESFSILGNYYLGSPGEYYTFIKVVLNSSGGNIIVSSKSDFKFISFYIDVSTYTKNISTDFALRFGLTNQLLDDLHIISQGTQASNNSASSLESSTSSFSSTASNVYNVEDQVSSGFSSSMQNIPSSFNFQNNFGSSFVVSASWVRDQFNNMTANNPFGSLITFSLILGVALLIIGRLLS